MIGNTIADVEMVFGRIIDMPMTRQQAFDLIEEMEHGQTDTVTLGVRIGLSAAEANSEGFRRLVESLWLHLDKMDEWRRAWDR